MSIALCVIGYVVSCLGLMVLHRKKEQGSQLFPTFGGRLAMLAIAAGLTVTIMWPIVHGELGAAWVLGGIVMIVGTVMVICKVNVKALFEGGK